MMTPNELRNHLGLPALEGTDAKMLLSALGSVAAIIGDEKIEASATWLDDLMPGAPSGVHIRLLLKSGLVTLDYDFGFDGLPDARFLPWSRVHALRVIAEPVRQAVVANVWLETDKRDIQFAGAGSSERFAEIVRAVRAHLI